MRRLLVIKLVFGIAASTADELFVNAVMLVVKMLYDYKIMRAF